jgi:PadR family transcriptional regulator AphA
MSIKHAILGLLNYRDMYGYQIKNHIEENFAFMWTVNYGQIYTGLKNLTEEGLITLKEVLPSEGGAPHKKLYSLTKKGQDEFKNWMKSSPGEKVLFRDPFMIHFIFLGFLETEEALRFIDEHIQIYEQNLASKKAELHLWKDRGIYVSLARDLGIRYRETYLEWLQMARKTIVAANTKKQKSKKKAKK